MMSPEVIAVLEAARRLLDSPCTLAESFTMLEEAERVIADIDELLSQ